MLYVDALMRSSVFTGIPISEMRLVTADLVMVRFVRHEAVYTEGEPGDRIYILLDGIVKASRRSADGRETLTAIMGHSDVFGESALLQPEPRSSTVTCVTDVVVAEMHRDDLRRLLCEYPIVRLELLGMLARRLQEANESLCDLISADVSTRTAKRLLEFCMKFSCEEGDRWRIAHELSLQELAQLVGTSRSRLLKTLSDYREYGWVAKHDGAIVILEPFQLRRRARSFVATRRVRGSCREG